MCYYQVIFVFLPPINFIMDIIAIKQRFGIVGHSPALDRAIHVAVQVASTDLSVLITGESGVGKENFAKIIHENSRCKHGNYIAVNCGAIPEGTIDSELFGHEKGAFTNATEMRKGYFEVADGGTIFLDEVGDLPAATQIRLLRVLESGEFMRVGASKPLKTQVRVVAATNADMSLKISNGKFREDLFYRLNTVPIHIPALRERKEDIPLLFLKFATDFAEKYRFPQIQLTPDATEILKNYYWPGNVRQLKHMVENISVVESSRTITTDILEKYISPENAQRNLPALIAAPGADKTEHFERELIYKFLYDLKREVTDLKILVNNMLDQDPHHLNHPIEHRKMTLPSSDPLSSFHIIDNPTFEADRVEPASQENAIVLDDDYSLVNTEKELIKKALDKNNFNRKKAAAELGISERTLYRKIKEYDL